jgi:hypothetical protein
MKIDFSTKIRDMVGLDLWSRGEDRFRNHVLQWVDGRIVGCCKLVGYDRDFDIWLLDDFLLLSRREDKDRRISIEEHSRLGMLWEYFEVLEAEEVDGDE